MRETDNHSFILAHKPDFPFSLILLTTNNNSTSKISHTFSKIGRSQRESASGDRRDSLRRSEEEKRRNTKTEQGRDSNFQNVKNKESTLQLSGRKSGQRESKEKIRKGTKKDKRFRVISQDRFFLYFQDSSDEKNTNAVNKRTFEF